MSLTLGVSTITNGRVTLELKEHLRMVENWDGVEFPTPLRGKSISNFEKNNQRAVLVIGWDGNDFVPLRMPTQGYDGEPISLFFMSGEDDVGHFGCIKNLSRTLGASLPATFRC